MIKCLDCSYENPDDARFCQNCGKPLQKICPVCGTANDFDARFCKNCGNNLQGVAAQPVLSAPPAPPQEKHTPSAHTRLEQYIPKELLAKLEAARTTQTLGGERRIVTILFCDVEGSTA